MFLYSSSLFTTEIVLGYKQMANLIRFYLKSKARPFLCLFAGGSTGK